MNPATDISVIIVSFNTKKLLLGCLDSLKTASERVRFEVTVVDNASSDGSQEAVEENFPEVELIRLKKNRGFAAANNIGIQRASGEYILLLNPDTEIPAGGLDRVFSAAREQGVTLGVMGIGLENQDGSIQPSARRDPGLSNLFATFTFLGAFGFGRKARKEYKMRDFDFSGIRDVDSVMGAAFLIPEMIIEKVGLLDEGYFMYFEEVDYCLRVRKAGFRVVFWPGIRIIHHGGASSDVTPEAAYGYSMLSMIRYYRMHVKGANRIMPFFKALFMLSAFGGLVTDPVQSLLYLMVGNIRRAKRKIARMKKRFTFICSENLWKFLNS